MVDLAYISSRLQELNFDDIVLKRYQEHHRYYHTVNHLTDVISYLLNENALDDELFLASVYHDAVYNPKANDNEERSAELFLNESKHSKLNKSQIDLVCQLILDTKTHKPSNLKSEIFINADLNIFNQPLSMLIEFEHKIFKEYQFADFKIYQKNRIDVLNQLNSNGKLDSIIDYVSAKKPSIGVFCGSFNPFHKGHYNVLQKAERIFDKVIIAFGKNPDKIDRTWEVPEIIKNRQIETYNGLLTDFVQSLNYDVVVVKGLRNSTDFQYEQNQYRYIQELMPGIKIINIFCDKEFEHISSSGIRTLEKFNRHQSYLLD
jgi:pantetheine-phosphate adenylyltransferase